MEKEKILVPPIKCQGIKTKLIPFIKEHIKRDETKTWIEPFVGSGVVAFNMKPQKALLTDKNPYIIRFYQGIQDGSITPASVRNFLEYHGKKLELGGADYYKEMRNAFNQNGEPLYFLFLNRSDFNGMIRFNKRGQFNVPFCQKPKRFSKAYITKICNQVLHVADVMQNRDWTFRCCSWRDTMKVAQAGDYIYLDPPYIGRDTSYVGEWPEQDAIDLATYAKKVPANVCLSMWKENMFRKNEHLFRYWSDFTYFDTAHFYHFGAKEKNRHAMTEVLAIKYV